MIFQFTHELVMSGKKTQTRRLINGVNLGVYSEGTPFATDSPYFDHRATVDVVMRESGFVLYEVGKTYAVQPGRGKKAVGRIRVTGIRREDVRHISWDDAIAEGFESPLGFLDVWTRMHDSRLAPLEMLDHIEQLPERPAERYQAWVIEFEVVAG